MKFNSIGFGNSIHETLRYTYIIFSENLNSSDVVDHKSDVQSGSVVISIHSQTSVQQGINQIHFILNNFIINSGIYYHKLTTEIWFILNTIFVQVARFQFPNNFLSFTTRTLLIKVS